MIGRVVYTGVALLLAAGGFFGDSPSPPGPLNPFGIAFLALAGVIWLGWDVIEAAYAYRDEITATDRMYAHLMIPRLGPLFARKSPRLRPGDASIAADRADPRRR